MIDAIRNGKMPAQPTPKYETHHGTIWPEKGMTKREAFTLAAIQGLCSNLEQVDDGANRISVCVADMAIQIADAALTKLSQSTGDDE